MLWSSCGGSGQRASTTFARGLVKKKSETEGTMLTNGWINKQNDERRKSPLVTAFKHATAVPFLTVYSVPPMASIAKSGQHRKNAQLFSK